MTEEKKMDVTEVEDIEDYLGQGEGRPDIDKAVLRDAKRHLNTLVQKRETAVNSLQQALQTAEHAKANSLVLRGRISVYEEAIADIEKQYGLKAQPQ